LVKYVEQNCSTFAREAVKVQGLRKKDINFCYKGTDIIDGNLWISVFYLKPYIIFKRILSVAHNLKIIYTYFCILNYNECLLPF